MITYKEAKTALKILDEAGSNQRRKPRANILYEDECTEPVNRKQRRIQESKQRRKR